MPRRAVFCQLGAEPVAARHWRCALAAHLIGFAADAAFGCGALDEIFGCADVALVEQVFVFLVQMIYRFIGAIPAAIAVEFATGAFQVTEQVIDFPAGLRSRSSSQRHGGQ